MIYDNWTHYETHTNVYYIVITVLFSGDINFINTVPSSFTTCSGVSICWIAVLSGLAPTAGILQLQCVTLYCKMLFRLGVFLGYGISYDFLF